jgi:hypothetical protein
MSERGMHPVEAGESPDPGSGAIPAPRPAESPDLEHRPSDLGHRPSDLGHRPSDLEHRPPDLGVRPIELGSGPHPIAFTAEPSSRRLRLRKIVLGSLLAVALAGAAVAGVTGWQIAAQKDATLVVPTQVAGLRLDKSENGESTADYLQTALSAEVDLDQAVGAAYLDAGGRNVLFFGGTALIWTPKNDLDSAFNLISDDQGAVAELHEVPAGRLGGTMMCGKTATDDGDMTVCGWADHGSLALGMFAERTEADSAELLRQIRASAQTRG